MSASLVGSEMCIRDSSLCYLSVASPWHLRGLQPSALLRRVRGGADTVSYTHLTLPTICSV
eukprot:738340-Alexandrium_andersonii.AAC.1